MTRTLHLSELSDDAGGLVEQHVFRALGAFQMAMDDNDVNVSAMISSFIIHEAGFGTPTTIAEAQHDVLLRPGAIDLLGQEIARGAACSSDFALVDHIALAPLPLEEVRARYGVRPPVDPGDGHHFAWQPAADRKSTRLNSSHT